jgi:hypothetical protein
MKYVLSDMNNMAIETDISSKLQQHGIKDAWGVASLVFKYVSQFDCLTCIATLDIEKDELDLFTDITVKVWVNIEDSPVVQFKCLNYA